MSISTHIQASVPSTSIEPDAIEPDVSDLLRAIVRAADDRKGEDIVLLKVGSVSYLADYFAIVTGFSKVQVRALSQSILARMEEECQRTCLRVEGQAEGSWVLLDYGDIIVHIMLPEERDYYSLEAFWGHAERVELASLTAAID
jgi:ribosome-associated protein